jgi:hypothetical protein
MVRLIKRVWEFTYNLMVLMTELPLPGNCNSHFPVISSLQGILLHVTVARALILLELLCLIPKKYERVCGESQAQNITQKW